jgi:hypothetical protein
MTKNAKYLKYKFCNATIEEMKRALSGLDRVILGKGEYIIDIRKGNSYIINPGENQTVVKDNEIDNFLKDHLNNGYAWYASFGKILKC